MTKKELREILEVAKSNVTLLDEDLSIFDGYGLKDFDKVYVTKNQVAKLIRWQTFQFNGNIDSKALNDLINIGSKKFIII